MRFKTSESPLQHVAPRRLSVRQANRSGLRANVASTHTDLLCLRQAHILARPADGLNIACWKSFLVAIARPTTIRNVSPDIQVAVPTPFLESKLVGDK